MKRITNVMLVSILSLNSPFLYAQEPIQIEIDIDNAPVEVQLPSPQPQTPAPSPTIVEEPAVPAEESPAVAETPTPDTPQEKEETGEGLPGIAIGALVAGILAALGGGGGGGGGGGSATSH